MIDDVDNQEPKRPRVLMVTDRVPELTSGYGIRVANVIDGIAAVADLHVCMIDSSFFGSEFRDEERYERTVLTASELPRWRRGLQRLWTIPNLAYLYEDDLQRRVAVAVGDQDWDLVWFSRARVHRLCAHLFDGPRILDLDDLNDRLLRSLAAERLRRRGVRAVPWSIGDWLVARRWSRYYRKLDAIPDKLVVTHAGDRAHLGRTESAIIPNGYRPLDDPVAERPGPPRLLFVGPLSYKPNFLAVHWLANEVIDRIVERVPDARLSVIGNLDGAPPPPAHEAIDYHGFVHDLDDHYAGATVAVAPLNAGGGTRVKILEAMARQRALVTTSFAIEGLGITPGEDVAVANDPRRFADECVSLLTDDTRRCDMVRRANATFLADHTATHTSRRVTELVSEVLTRAGESSGRVDR